MARVLRQTTVVRDGQHNAFTDLIFWQGCYWVGYRKGASHVSMDGEACVAVSSDRERFREVAHVKVPGDNRDPKFVAMPDGRLAMYFPTWLGGYKKRHLQQFVTFSDDGFHWEKPQPVHKPHWWLWRIAEHNGRFYSAAYTYLDDKGQQSDTREVELLVSDDMLNWQSVSKLGGAQGSESGMHFFEDGTLWVVTRNARDVEPAYFSVARPPYTTWQTTPLEEMVHSPVILEHDGKLFVSGRRNVPIGEANFGFYALESGAPKRVSSLGIWELKEGSITPALHIPAYGDCAYPGLIKDPEGRICLSYYSEHAYGMGVVPDTFHPDGHRVAQNDVYFAEIEL